EPRPTGIADDVLLVVLVDAAPAERPAFLLERGVLDIEQDPVVRRLERGHGTRALHASAWRQRSDARAKDVRMFAATPLARMGARIAAPGAPAQDLLPRSTDAAVAAHDMRAGQQVAAHAARLVPVFDLDQHRAAH